MTTNRSLLRRAAGSLVAVFIVGTASCSFDPTLHPVRGKVLMNTKPAAGAMVVFHPEGADIKSVPASGQCGADGTFSLSTGSKPGAAAGKYVVTIIWPDASKKATESQTMMGLAPDQPDLLGGRYATTKVSKLTAEVKVGENDIATFEVK
jgi:hypothetical protein